MKFTAVMVVDYQKPWYALAYENRIDFEHEHVFPAIAGFVKAGGEVTPVRAIRYGHEAESFFVMRFEEMEDYLDLVRQLRSSRLITDAMAEISFEVVGLNEAYFAERDAARPAVAR
ncbi:hypothetical protein LWF15_19290 [Kineosporia rhizophila]|uniref:hypothetical protein n=1 Tax=Kineosporia TaxID=49184 RepID=UPI001E4D7780|nr:MULTISPECIES: hypothetical protein [Kineosporia]MCE0537638.1 hypothetical protein [Kineosporia rhizophila]GLY18847.1 hypothetical protein Kisp01_58610 [Kineosporia sp. NBRC 101677]